MCTRRNITRRTSCNSTNAYFPLPAKTERQAGLESIKSEHYEGAIGWTASPSICERPRSFLRLPQRPVDAGCGSCAVAWRAAVCATPPARRPRRSAVQPAAELMWTRGDLSEPHELPERRFRPVSLWPTIGTGQCTFGQREPHPADVIEFRRSFFADVDLMPPEVASQLHP